MSLKERGRMLQMHAIGNFDRRVVIRNYTLTTEHGEEFKDFADWQTVWAARDDMAGKEDNEADKETAYTRTTFYIRYLSGVQKDYQLVDEYSNIYDIKAVLEVGRRRYLKLITELRE